MTKPCTSQPSALTALQNLLPNDMPHSLLEVLYAHAITTRLQALGAIAQMAKAEAQTLQKLGLTEREIRSALSLFDAVELSAVQAHDAPRAMGGPCSSPDDIWPQLPETETKNCTPEESI